MKAIKHEKTEKLKTSKRALLGFGTTALLSPIWCKPVINAVILPVHAQTSTTMCVTDTTVGGPLSGAPGNPATCQAACETEAMNMNAQLCEVRETETASGTDCACDLDTS